MTKPGNDFSREHDAAAQSRLQRRAHDIYLARGAADGMGLDGRLLSDAEVGAEAASTPALGDGRRPGTGARRGRGGSP